MKKILYSLLTLAAALTVTSCLKEVEGGSAAYDDGTLVDATFSVTLGPQTKAFADGTTVNQLYAGIYEITGTDIYAHVTHTESPAAISGKAGEVSFTGKIKRGHSYKIVFWAQKEGAPYTLAWGEAAPTVTVTPAGEANAENRDAFYGEFLTGEVSGNIDLTGSPITLKRPFAQVNVLVPNGNFSDLSAEVTSSMTVAQAPTVLNLATKATSAPADWTFSTATIGEDAFGSYASTHKYVAMNYVLVPQDAAGAGYDVTFSVTSAASPQQVASNKQVKNTPLKPNGRTNIVGNVFAEDFDITVPVIIDPGASTEQELTTVTVKVGQTAADAVELTFDATNPSATSITVAVSHPVEVEADKPQITVEPATVATAEWNLTTGKLDVTPLVANGNAVITLVFPAVTKTKYSAATVQVYVKVGNGQNDTQTQQLAKPVLSAQNAVADETTIVLDWENVENASSYAVTYKVKDAQGEATTVTPAPTASEVTLSGLTAGTTYTITVQALPASTSTEYTASEVATIDLTTESPAADVKTLKSIAVTAPTKVEYTEGETLDLTDMVVKATYSHSNGDEDSEETITEGFTTTPSAGATLATTNDKVTVSYTEGGVTKTAEFTITVSAAVQPDFTTIAGLKDLLGAESASFTGTLTDAVVSFVAGTRDAVIKDATGSILYHKETGHNLLQGQTISGDVIVDAVLYNGINEITDLAATVEGTGSAVEPQVVTLAQLAADYATYESAYVKVVGVTSKTTTTAKGNISVTQDATDYIVYTNVAIPVNTGDIFTAEGTVTKYNSTEEIKVWKSADLTVTTEAPILSATPATKTVNATDTQVTWTITSNTDWTITQGTGVTASATSGNGNADVTLSFDKNMTEQSREFTAKVSATGCDDVTITITQNGTGSTTVPIEIVAKASSICSSTNYDAYSNDDWIMTCGSSNGSFGSNSGNADTKMKLGDNYVVATPLDAIITSSSTHYAALISKGKLDAGITSITLSGTIGSGMTVGVTVSTDGTTWTKLADFGSATSFSFSAQQSVYYAVVIKAANKSNAKYTDFTATFSNQ